MDVGEIRRDADGDFVPDRLGQAVVVDGVLTYERYGARGDEEFRAYVQDPSGAMRLIEATPGALSAAERWDRVRLEGRVSQYRGMTQLEVDRVAVIAPGEPLVPRRVTTGEIGEELEGRLVTVEGAARIREDLRVDDGSGSVRVYLRGSVFGDLNVEQVLAGGAVSVTGIVEQFDSGERPDGSYRLTPRSSQDLAAIPSDSRGFLTSLSLGSLLLVVTFAALFVRSHRLARRRGQVLEHQERTLEELTATADGLRRQQTNWRARLAVHLAEGQGGARVGSSADASLDETTKEIAGHLQRALMQIRPEDRPERTGRSGEFSADDWLADLRRAASDLEKWTDKLNDGSDSEPESESS